MVAEKEEVAQEEWEEKQAEKVGEVMCIRIQLLIPVW